MADSNEAPSKAGSQDPRDFSRRAAIKLLGCMGALFAVGFGMGVRPAYALDCGEVGSGGVEPDSACGTNPGPNYQQDSACGVQGTSDGHCGGATSDPNNAIDTDMHCATGPIGARAADNACGRSDNSDGAADGGCSNVNGAVVDRDGQCGTTQTGQSGTFTSGDDSCNVGAPGHTTESDVNCGYHDSNGVVDTDQACNSPVGNPTHVDSDTGCAQSDIGSSATYGDGSCGAQGSADVFADNDQNCGNPPGGPGVVTDQDNSCGTAQSGVPHSRDESCGRMLPSHITDPDENCGQLINGVMDTDENCGRALAGGGIDPDND